MIFEESLLNEIEKIAWFSDLGERSQFGGDVVQLGDWRECESSFTDSNWENITLEARNSLTSFLHNKYPAAYDDWNKMTKEGKRFLENRIYQKIESANVPFENREVFYACVRWDLLGCLMENAYREYEVPQFFSRVLEIYKQGHFPCGWQGPWPDGKLIVF